jgi:hypothetical protein
LSQAWTKLAPDFKRDMDIPDENSTVAEWMQTIEKKWIVWAERLRSDGFPKPLKGAYNAISSSSNHFANHRRGGSFNNYGRSDYPRNTNYQRNSSNPYQPAQNPFQKSYSQQGNSSAWNKGFNQNIQNRQFSNNQSNSQNSSNSLNRPKFSSDRPKFGQDSRQNPGQKVPAYHVDPNQSSGPTQDPGSPATEPGDPEEAIANKSRDFAAGYLEGRRDESRLAQVQSYDYDQDADDCGEDYDYEDNDNGGYYDSFAPFGYQHHISPTFTCVNCREDFTSNNKLHAYLTSCPAKASLPAETKSSQLADSPDLKRVTSESNLSQTAEVSPAPEVVSGMISHKRVILAKGKSLDLAKHGTFFRAWHYTVASASLTPNAPAEDICMDTGGGLTTVD